MRNVRCLILLVIMAGAQTAKGQFIPGHVYVSDFGPKPCYVGNPALPNDRIWDFDPATGQVSLFAEVSDALCGGMTGLAFTPAGAALRASMEFHSLILEFDGNANPVIALDGNDGIAGPGGTNNIAYDDFGNFFVVNADSGTILRFAPDDGPADVLADLDDFVISPGAIATFPNGDLLYANGLSAQILFRITPSGMVTVFDTLPQPGLIWSVEISTSGEVFALDGAFGGRLFRYPGGNAGARELFVQGFIDGSSASSIALSGDQSLMYVANEGNLQSVDLSSGTILTVGTVPGPWFSAGAGIAVYVPEPAMLGSLAIAALVVTRRRPRGIATDSAPYH